MKKADLAKMIGGMALAAATGGGLGEGAKTVVSGVGALLHRNDNPDDDLDETVAALVKIGVGSLQTTEDLSGKDIVNDPVLLAIAENISRDVALFQRLLVDRHGAKTAQPAV